MRGRPSSPDPGHGISPPACAASYGAAQRISVVGCSGSGKTTLARELSRRLGIPHVELDALSHGPNWTTTPDDDFRRQVAERIRDGAWVIDGNYSLTRDLVWGSAQLVIWLDYPLPVVMTRVVRRTHRRVVSQEELWNGNRESLRTALSRESIILWALASHRRTRLKYTRLLVDSPDGGFDVVRLTSPAAADAWLSRCPLPR